MTSTTRYFLLGAASFLALGLAGGLIAYYGVPGIDAFSSEPDELVYVPADATVVAFADVREIMASGVRQQLQQMFPAGADAEGRRRFEQETGINVETDIGHVVAYLVPAAERDSQGDGVLLARGRFDQARIEQLIEQHGGTAETYRGRRILVRGFGSAAGSAPNPESPIPSPGSPTPNPQSRTPNPAQLRDMALAFVQSGLVAVGTNAAVRRSIDLESGRESNITTNDDFMSLVRDSDEGNVWVVGSFDRLTGFVQLPQNLIRNLPAITYFSVMGRIDSAVSGILKAQTRDAQAARDLSDVVRGFIALGKLQTGAWPELQTVLQSLQLQSDDKTVTLSFALPAGALQALAQRRPPRRAQ